MYVHRPKHPIPDTYSDYLRKAEKKDPETYKGYRDALFNKHDKIKDCLRFTFNFNPKK